MQFATIDHIVAAIGDEMTLNPSEANELFERACAPEQRRDPRLDRQRRERHRKGQNRRTAAWQSSRPF